ncbi:hypothetical protein PR202_ga00660 [Eleusine coracana subsp. coracana]|uniref:Terpene synthase metal-binding domain-containing protein n=1 Tax=Eleusine coracana subsp. coracana TaxID=191504 RepID=A0AAV5BEI1_ELECO|nr:hypothetical protein PR202_ga00660 [Eleusine coracana subsp. coracana]
MRSSTIEWAGILPVSTLPYGVISSFTTPTQLLRPPNCRFGSILFSLRNWPRFLTFANREDEHFDGHELGLVKMTERADKLKEEVVAMIDASSTWSLLERLHLIHVLQRLCLDYLFEDAINGLLTQIKHADVTACDLQTTIDWVRAYNTEVKWRDNRYIPATVEEHLQLSVRTGACHLLSCASFVGMDDIATEESFHWVTSMPKIVHSLCIILRLLDDLQSYEREQRMLHIASTIDSCMKQHNLSINLARKKIRELVDEEWKVLNGQWLKPKKDQPKELLERIFNLARTMEFFYEQDDAYTNSYIVKDIINSSFVDFFTLH